MVSMGVMVFERHRTELDHRKYSQRDLSPQAQNRQLNRSTEQGLEAHIENMQFGFEGETELALMLHKNRDRINTPD